MTRDIALEGRLEDGERLFSPSAARNREVVRAVIADRLANDGTVLEVGSGTGEHAVCFAAALPRAVWAPGDPDPASRASIAAWTAHSGLANIRAPHAIDVCAQDWGVDEIAPFSGVVSLNMIHIAPFEAARGLVAGAGRYLRAGGVLFLYGPFSREGAYTSPSNGEFDRSLKSRDPRWGVRDLDREIVPLAEEAGLTLHDVVAMPANNLSIIFEKRA